MSNAMKFRDIPVGATFDWIGCEPSTVSFYKRCTKTAPRLYVDEDGQRYRVGSINAIAWNVKAPA